MQLICKCITGSTSQPTTSTSQPTTSTSQTTKPPTTQPPRIGK